MKNSIFALFLFCFMSSGLVAQSSDTAPVRVPGEENTFSRVADMPQFPGCESFEGNKTACANKTMMKYIYKHPNFAAQQSLGVKGTCVYKFIVDANGAVSDVRIIRALRDDPAFINETKAIFEGMPTWNPGKQDGKAVNVEMSIPLSFAVR